MTPTEQQRKRELIACFPTQRETLSAFGVLHERFRIAPEYGFRRPAHEGTVLYDRHPWGMTAARFAALAAQAETQLAEAGTLRAQEAHGGRAERCSEGAGEADL